MVRLHYCNTKSDKRYNSDQYEYTYSIVPEDYTIDNIELGPVDAEQFYSGRTVRVPVSQLRVSYISYCMSF